MEEKPAYFWFWSLLREETFTHKTFNGDITTTETVQLISENRHP